MELLYSAHQRRKTGCHRDDQLRTGSRRSPCSGIERHSTPPDQLPRLRLWQTFRTSSSDFERPRQTRDSGYLNFRLKPALASEPARLRQPCVQGAIPASLLSPAPVEFLQLNSARAAQALQTRRRFSREFGWGSLSRLIGALIRQRNRSIPTTLGWSVILLARTRRPVAALGSSASRSGPVGCSEPFSDWVNYESPW